MESVVTTLFRFVLNSLEKSYNFGTLIANGQKRGGNYQ